MARKTKLELEAEIGQLKFDKQRLYGHIGALHRLNDETTRLLLEDKWFVRAAVVLAFVGGVFVTLALQSVL